MRKDEIINILKTLRPGSFHNFTYRSAKPTCDGSTIYKVSVAYARTKINNTARRDYVEPSFKKNEDVTYLIDKCVKHNNKTNNDLVMLFLRKGNKVKFSHYEDENGNPIDTAYAKSVIVEKPHSSSFSGVLTPKVENILAVR